MRLMMFAFLWMGIIGNAQTNAGFKKLDFLLGKWSGVAGKGDTATGAGQGDFSFQPELNQKVIVRRNSAHYESGEHHDDLMVIYLDAPDSPRAIYFDTEGHVIHYRMAFPSANRVVFDSDPSQSGPKYRLTYWLDGESLNGSFEVAAPGSGYKPYLKWTSRRRS